MRQKLKGEIDRDFGNRRLAQNNLLQESRFGTGGAGCAGQRIIDEIMQAIGAMGVRLILDLRYNFVQQLRIINRFGAQPLCFAGGDFVQIGGVEAHGTCILCYCFACSYCVNTDKSNARKTQRNGR